METKDVKEFYSFKESMLGIWATASKAMGSLVVTSTLGILGSTLTITILVLAFKWLTWLFLGDPVDLGFEDMLG